MGGKRNGFSEPTRFGGPRARYGSPGRDRTIWGVETREYAEKHAGVTVLPSSTGQGCRAGGNGRVNAEECTRRHSMARRHGLPLLDEIYRSVRPRRGSRRAYHEFAFSRREKRSRTTARTGRRRGKHTEDSTENSDQSHQSHQSHGGGAAATRESNEDPASPISGKKHSPKQEIEF